MRTYITYISKQPVCRVCGKPMETWIFGIPANKQSHPECEGTELARITMKELVKRWRNK